MRCGIGSVKTNVGHLETAAGIAGMLKLLLALKHRAIPGSLNFQALNSFINLQKSPFYVVDRTAPWELPASKADQPRRGGISSFGFGRVNAHMIVEEFRDSAAAAATA